MQELAIYNKEIEIQILGSCISSKKVFEVIKNSIEMEDFYNSNNQRLFKALNECYKEKGSTDVLSFYEVLKRNNLTISYVVDVSGGALDITDITPYTRELLKLREEREVLKLSKDIQRGLLKDTEDINKGLKAIESIKVRMGNGNSIISLDKVEIVDVYTMEKVKTGFEAIDKKILGFSMGTLNIITGYNGNGKSTLINQMCIAQSLSQGYKVFAYSPELTSSNLKSWLYPTIANREHFVKKTYGGNEYSTLGVTGIKYIDKWLKSKLFIYSDDSITSDEKRLLLDMEVLVEKGVKVFIIDNLMKIDLVDSFKNELIAQKTFVNKLKNFARKYNAIVHLVAHPRKPQQGNSVITKFDIAGSGDITNLADYVISISRVSEKDKRNPKSEVYDKDAVIKIMKDRIKGTGEFLEAFKFEKERKRFYQTQKEIDKDYGYTNGYDLVQIELDCNKF